MWSRNVPRFHHIIDIIDLLLSAKVKEFKYERSLRRPIVLRTTYAIAAEPPLR